jgi:phosphate starvation-inducible protein PhoH and related proteins
MKRDRVKEERDFKELTSVNGDMQIKTVKDEVAKLLPNDIKILARNESQKKLINSIKNNDITICGGRAGTGKTYVAMAYALSLLRKASNRYKKIYLVKSVTTLKGEELGFLKGDLKEKIDPFMWSFYINMEKIVLESIVKQLIDTEIIRPFPLAYMRGVSLDDCIIIADEIQNVTLDNSLTLLTRIGSNCKLIVLGDVNQVDMKDKTDSSLRALLEMFENVDNMGVIRMDENDENVRHPLIKIIEEKFKEYLANHGRIAPRNGNKVLLLETPEKKTHNSNLNFEDLSRVAKAAE